MSDFFEWDAGKYGLNVQAMDDDHQEIIECMNHLHVLHETQQGRARIGEALHELLEVTRRHFADEEAYMRKIKFPDAAKHAMIHCGLISRLEEFHTAFRLSGALSDDLFPFLKFWLKSHICGIDTQYARYGKESKAAAAG